MRRALVWAVCVAACAAPELDRTGSIRCGVATEPNGGCPDGYECNGGRCCPQGAQGCPTLSNACEVGGVAPFPAQSPPAQCASPGPVGRACTGAGSCSSGTNCFTQVPGGYCSMSCVLPINRNACQSAGGACVNVTGVPFGEACIMRCSLPAGETVARCRNDQPGRYVCTRVQTRMLDEVLCIPDCATTPSICGASSHCDLRTHLCVGNSS